MDKRLIQIFSKIFGAINPDALKSFLGTDLSKAKFEKMLEFECWKGSLDKIVKVLNQRKPKSEKTEISELERFG